jgi:hypothetical protein
VGPWNCNDLEGARAVAAEFGATARKFDAGLESEVAGPIGFATEVTGPIDVHFSNAGVRTLVEGADAR